MGFPHPFYVQELVRCCSNARLSLKHNVIDLYWCFCIHFMFESRLVDVTMPVDY